MTITSFPIVGIVLAVVSALFLTIANFLQSRGVARAATGGAGIGAVGFWRLARDPIWLVGGALFGLAIVVQLAALAFAPLMVVQPVGVVALVFASLLTALVTRTRPRWREVISIAVCVVSLGVFVSVAAAVSEQTTITDTQLIAVLIVLLAVLALTFGALAVFRRRRTPAVVYVLLGGLYSGFVATLGKTVILRVQTAIRHRDDVLDETNLLTIACAAGIAVAGALSIWFVQTAHTVNNPQVVVAGLTVVDPFVAVVLGITVLQEAASAPVWSFAVFAVAGTAAIAGVWALAREQPAEASAGGAPADASTRTSG
ncbi:DMT family transporter [Microbacterium sp. SSW1-59]|uniref:DMT family transporter n=1 Tax=Microbacterium xanthum TaxID=3079794 RepID=UPI002AD311A1|nr:DMT family transporter [Microbacterium sp. SSW1-59]MDZ8202578.1 DMT family transporter [Microbacterium sp. SSW1-59]